MKKKNASFYQKDGLTPLEKYDFCDCENFFFIICHYFFLSKTL